MQNYWEPFWKPIMLVPTFRYKKKKKACKIFTISAILLILCPLHSSNKRLPVHSLQISLLEHRQMLTIIANSSNDRFELPFQEGPSTWLPAQYRANWPEVRLSTNMGSLPLSHLGMRCTVSNLSPFLANCFVVYFKWKWWPVFLITEKVYTI